MQPRDWFLKHVTTGNIEGRIEVTGRNKRRRRYFWMNIKKREYIGNLESKHSNTRFGELTLEEAIGLS
jgi:hypothetical protein